MVDCEIRRGQFSFFAVRLVKLVLIIVLVVEHGLKFVDCCHGSSDRWSCKWTIVVMGGVGFSFGEQ